MRRFQKAFTKTLAALMAVVASVQFSCPSWAQATALSSSPVTLTTAYQPAVIKGLTIDPVDPFAFDFLVDGGDDPRDTETLKQTSSELIKYFLASLSIPEEHMWVNLSPYEPDRIIPSDFGQTQMGQELLALDYLLKQLSSSLMNPDDEVGKKFWDKIYQRAMEQYGTTDIPMDTFNKIWIVPSQASVSVKGQTVFIKGARLKVMLEEDYVALQKTLGVEHFGLEGRTDENKFAVSGVTSDVVRNILIPAVEQEVNEGRTFAKLRQIYHSMILASWYKKNLKDSFLNRMVADSGMTAGVEAVDPKQHEAIYQQYVEAFRSGAFDLIREDYDPASQQLVPRKYFSGGLDMHMKVQTGPATEDDASLVGQSLFEVKASVIGKSDAAMMALFGKNIFGFFRDQQDQTPGIEDDAYRGMHGTADALGDFLQEKGVHPDDFNVRADNKNGAVTTDYSGWKPDQFEDYVKDFASKRDMDVKKEEGFGGSSIFDLFRKKKDDDAMLTTTEVADQLKEFLKGKAVAIGDKQRPIHQDDLLISEMPTKNIVTVSFDSRDGQDGFKVLIEEFIGLTDGKVHLDRVDQGLGDKKVYDLKVNNAMLETVVGQLKAHLGQSGLIADDVHVDTLPSKGIVTASYDNSNQSAFQAAVESFVAGSNGAVVIDRVDQGLGDKQVYDLKVNSAMLGKDPQVLGANENTGGINLNSKMLDLDTGGETRQIVVPVGDPAMLKERISRFEPVIKSIQPFNGWSAAVRAN